jgi:hypothetical protein
MDKKHNIDKFQGYPHYPPGEDITQPKNNTGKERLEEDKTHPVPPFNDTMDERDTEAAIVMGTDADVTEDDLRLLESSEQNMDTPDSRNLIFSSLDNTDNDGDLLNVDGSLADDVTGDDLDVPGSEADDDNEIIGEEDEENNYYSLGGDNHESQEENKGE